MLDKFDPYLNWSKRYGHWAVKMRQDNVFVGTLPTLPFLFWFHLPCKQNIVQLDQSPSIYFAQLQKRTTKKIIPPSPSQFYLPSSNHVQEYSLIILHFTVDFLYSRANTISAWKCSDYRDSRFQWHFPFQTLFWVRILRISCFFVLICRFCKWVFEIVVFFIWDFVDMWPSMKFTGRNCTTILLSLKEIHPRILLFFGLMVDLGAPALMVLFMSMVMEILLCFI